MKTMLKPVLSILQPRRFQGWALAGTGMISFIAGSLFTLRLAQVREARADSNRVFELMIYHTENGKVPALESVFRDVAKLQSRHNMNVIGYWVPNEDAAWNNTFVYLVAHPSRQEAEASWKALHSDPEFPPHRKAAAPLIEKVGGEYHVDEIYMRPTDFSAMK